jgi:hypothetical protein
MFVPSASFAVALGKHGFPFEEIPAGPAAPAALPGGGGRLHVFHVWPRNMAAAEQDRFFVLADELFNSVFPMELPEAGSRERIVGNDCVALVAAHDAVTGELQMCCAVAFQLCQRRWGTVWFCSLALARPAMQRLGLAGVAIVSTLRHLGLPKYLVGRTSSTATVQMARRAYRDAVAEQKGQGATAVLHPLEDLTDSFGIAADARRAATLMVDTSKMLRGSRDLFNADTMVFEGIWPPALRDVFATAGTSPVGAELNRRINRERGDAQLFVCTWWMMPVASL